MGKDKKKKGKGAEKTALKTEKKAVLKLKKELKAKGEDDIELLIAQFQNEDQKRNAVTSEITAPPTLRSNVSFTAHPDKDELILFGGEYFNGQTTVMFNDLYIYSIKKNEWSLVKVPNGPTPRSSHQAVALSQAGGQLWIFGGEFDSPTQSQFYHYKELWVYHINEKRWEKINASGAPSARSGHRMVAVKKNLFIFGGFHDYVRDYKYYNDIYMFDTENYKWHKLEPSGVFPAPRSGCQMAALADGRIVIYGGYSKVKVKKEDKGIIHTDMFYLQPEKNDQTGLKWKWVSVKHSGSKFSPRCGFSSATVGINKAVIFGGVYDEEDTEDQLNGTFYNDMYQLELDKGKWYTVNISHQNKTVKKQRRQRKEKAGTSEDTIEDSDTESEEEETDEIVQNQAQLESLKLAEKEVKTVDDGIFTVTIGPQTSQSPASAEDPIAATSVNAEGVFVPSPRINPAVVVKNSVLYLYGGVYEIVDKQFTLCDFYSLDLKKLDGWKVIISPDAQKQQWVDSESSSEDEGAVGGEEEESGDEDDLSEESDEDSSNEKMDVS